jgi:hypothetical protein
MPAITLPPIKVSYSGLTTGRDCPLKHRWHYFDGYRIINADKKLQLGSAWHECVLENHYQTIKDYQDFTDTGLSPERGSEDEKSLLSVARDAVHSALTAALRGEKFSQLSPDDYDTLRWMYAGYTDLYGCDPQWRILDVEFKGLVPLGTITTQAGPRDVVLDFRIDLVVEDLELGGIFAIESKSAANLSTRFALELDDQTGLYEWAFRNSGHPQALTINGCVRSEAKKTMNVGDKPGATKGKAQTLQARHQRIMVPRTPIELEAIRRDALATTQALYGGLLPIYSGPNPSQCGWKCQFQNVHIDARKGHSVPQLMEDAGFKQIPTEFNGLTA